jgi:hypothetical protein
LNQIGRNFVALAGKLVLLGAVSVEQTGFIKGRTYAFVAVGGTALVRWDTTAATIADGGFDFAVPPGETVYAVARDTLVNIIEAEAGSTATAAVLIGEVGPY